MKRLVAASALALIWLAGIVPARAAFDDLEKSWESFYSTGLETSKAISVENLTIQKDAMTLVLKKGILVPMQPIEGEVTGAMFMGEGTATLIPPAPMDTWYLKKYYGADKFTENFTALFMRFSDGTDKSFPAPALGTSSASVASNMKDIAQTFGDRQGVADGWESERFDMDLDFLDTRIGGIHGQDFFYCQFQTAKWGWVTFMVNYGDVLEVSLGHDRTVGAYRQYLGWAEFHRKEDYQQGRYVMLPVPDSKENLDVIRTDMNVSIPTTKTVEIDAKLTLAPLVSSLGSIRFSLVNQFGNISWRDTSRPITVSSVTDGAGNPLPYIHKRNELLIRPPKALNKGENYVVEVKAKEDTIVQITSEAYVVYNTYPWFPQYGYSGGRYAFDFNISIQKPLIPIGSGHVVKRGEDKETKMDFVELRMDDPVQFPSILFGRFLEEAGTYQSPISNQSMAFTVHAFPTMTGTITDKDVLEQLGRTQPFTFELVVPTGKMKSVLEESENIVKFYENLYGPFPYGDLHVAQMYPGSGYGQSPPSLIQLDGLSFQSQADLESDFLHEFLSHEIGHQYWAHCIGWANDNDVWLSESFAEYSAGLYVQALLGEKRFQQKMSTWKQRAREGDPVAPIALASLVSGDNSGRYRERLIYNKGPLVVHMMRTQLGNENYVKFVTGLMKKYKNQNITTEMLSRELSLATNYNWDYFFDQWFRGVGIPEIHTKWKTTPKDGKYLFEMTVTQKDAENFKKVFLPVVFKGSGKEQVARKDFPIGKQGQVIQIMLPFDPKTVEVDPDNNLLADYVQDK